MNRQKNTRNVLEYLEQSAGRLPDKTAVIDDKTSCTYAELLADAQAIGAYLTTRIDTCRPVAVYMDKSVDTLKLFYGIVYAGCFYTLVDPGFPKDRVRGMLSVLDPAFVFAQEDRVETLAELGFSDRTGDLTGGLEEVLRAGRDILEKDQACLERVRKAHIDTNPLYCNFTSGSTGIPKGVLVGHRSVIEFIECFTELFDITEEDVIGNQAPFDFDVSVKDIYSAVSLGATLVIIPRSSFMFPNAVVDMLEKHGCTTLIWAVSALTLLARLHGLKYKVPAKVNKILFSGEQMPVKMLNVWKSYLPDATYVNLYGPTEITCNCTYHVLDRDYEDGEKLPMGGAFPNEKVFLLSDDDKEIGPQQTGITGELCVAGTALAIGYYKNEEATAKAFTDNPLVPDFPERIYRTGDLAYYGEDGLLYFAGRKDFQIKHMGHRIELEEIERSLGAVSLVERCCCYFDEAKGKVIAVYEGGEDKRQIIDEMKEKVPEYMVPNRFVRVDALPLTKNGKVDRKAVREM